MNQMEDSPRVAKPEVLLAWLVPGVCRCFIWTLCCFLSQPSADVLKLCADNKQKLQVYLPQTVRISYIVTSKNVFTRVIVGQVLTIRGKKDNQKYVCHPALTEKQASSYSSNLDKGLMWCEVWSKHINEDTELTIYIQQQEQDNEKP